MTLSEQDYTTEYKSYRIDNFSYRNLLCSFAGEHLLKVV